MAVGSDSGMGHLADEIYRRPMFASQLTRRLAGVAK